MTNRARWPAVVVGAAVFLAGVAFSEVVMDPRQAAARQQIDATPEAPSLKHLMTGAETVCGRFVADLKDFRAMHPQYRKPGVAVE